MIGVKLTRDGEGRELGVCEPGDTYSGLAGIGILGAALWSIGSGEKYRETAVIVAETMLRTLANANERDWDECGAFAGSTSLVYVLSILGAMLDEPEYISAAVAQLPTLESWRQSEEVDVISGHAGRCLSLLATRASLLKVDNRLDELVRRSAEALVRQCGSADKLPAKLVHSSTPAGRSGFAHGSAGVAAALARSHAAGIGNYSTEANQALDEEWELFEPASGSWPANGSSGPFVPDSQAWCYGGPGILLAISEAARAGIHVDGKWIDRAIRATIDSRPGSDGLCHGLSGVAGVAILAGGILGRPDLTTLGNGQLEAIAGRYLFGGGLLIEPVSELAHSPGLMVGATGIGLALLGSATGGNALRVLEIG